MSLSIAAPSSILASISEDSVVRSPGSMANDVERATDSAVTSPQSARIIRLGDWTRPQMWLYTLIIVSLPAIVGFSSSVQVPALSAIAIEFNCSRGLAAVSASTYLVGFGLGPFIFAPLSEVFGRNPIYYTTFSLFTLTTLACGFAPSMVALLILRFLAGFFGSPAVANSGGSLTDLWTPEDRSVPLALFTAASFCGPVLAPIIGGALTQYAGWRWDFWFVAILSAIILMLVVIILPETYPTKRMGKGRAQVREKNSQRSTISDFKESLARPWLMFAQEPILFCLSLYMAFIYGVLYLDFTAYPIIYQESRGWSLSMSGLSFLGIGTGMAIGTAMSPLLDRLRAYYVVRIGSVPEARLPHLIPAAWLMPIGLFVFAWTAEPPVHWIFSILAGVPFGFGLVILFLGINAYLTDCYERYSASALAANALLRCIFGATFAVFADIMYGRLGTPWATSLLGFIAIGLTPLPWLFRRYGPYLRSKSKYHQFSIST